MRGPAISIRLRPRYKALHGRHVEMRYLDVKKCTSIQSQCYAEGLFNCRRCFSPWHRHLSPTDTIKQALRHSLHCSHGMVPMLERTSQLEWIRPVVDHLQGSHIPRDRYNKHTRRNQVTKRNKKRSRHRGSPTGGAGRVALMYLFR